MGKHSKRFHHTDPEGAVAFTPLVRTHSLFLLKPHLSVPSLHLGFLGRSWQLNNPSACMLKHWLSIRINISDPAEVELESPSPQHQLRRTHGIAAWIFLTILQPEDEESPIPSTASFPNVFGTPWPFCLPHRCLYCGHSLFPHVRLSISQRHTGWFSPCFCLFWFGNWRINPPDFGHQSGSFDCYR